MTVDKIITPPTKDEVVDKINEVIDNLGGQGTAPVWGNISGTLSNQTDLQSALDGKQDNLGVLNAGNNISIVKQGINLPSGYTQVNGVTNSGQTFVNTGFQITTDDMEFEITVKPSLGSWYIFQTRPPLVGISGANSGSKIIIGLPDGTSLRSNIVRNASHIYYVRGSLKNGNASLYVEDLTSGDTDSVTTTYTFQTVNKNIYLFANPDGNYVASGNTVFRATLSIGGSVVMDYIPAVYNNTVGFYDLISQTFKTASRGTLIAGEEISNDTIINFVNTSGYITGITSSDVTTALGYTPYNSTNPNGYITASALNGYATEQWVTNKNYVNSTTLTNTLADYVLSASLSSVATSGSYNDLTNKPTIPSEVTESTVLNWGFTKNTGTVTSVNNVQPINGNVTLTIPDTSNLANKDLSNLSSTGNAKFQVPLVSGTNIKTINNNSILGSGNLVLDGLPTQTGKAGKFLTTDGTDASWGVVKTHNLLEFKWSDHLLDDVSWLRADTFSWQSGDVYTSAYNHLVQDIQGTTAETETIGSYTVTFYRATDGHKICLADQEQTVLNIYNTYGIAWYYILDTTNTQFKLPRTKYGFEGLRTNVGDKIDESLPNITGGISSNGSYQVLRQGTPYGAFTLTSSSGGLAGESYANANGFDFDASRSSSTYQNNAPVQERATQMYLYFYVGDYSQTAIEQTAGITSEQLNAKVDVSSLSEIYPVIETYQNGTSWYRVYSDGWCIQGGSLTASQNNNTTVNFLKPFLDDNYCCFVTSKNATQVCGTESRTASSFHPIVYGGASARDWVACGYII